MSFAAFIITYERASILPDTIAAILQQSAPPQKILVVDNSVSRETENLFLENPHAGIEYLRVGYNAGPAGAAKIGLQKLADEGYDWIYWGDDDDPPQFNDVFEKLLELPLANKGLNVGILGIVGHSFNRWNGNLIRTSDDKLYGSDFIQVDSIAGGQSMLVNGKLVREGILPEPSYFFGFEELDFCLKAQKAGYSLLVSTALFLRVREKYGRLKYTLPVYLEKEVHQLKRQYYSTRNLLIILDRNKLYGAYVYQVMKALVKALYGFLYGWNYGRVNFKMLMMGIVHALIYKMNKVY